jgi:hypothetical protein
MSGADMRKDIPLNRLWLDSGWIDTFVASLFHVLFDWKLLDAYPRYQQTGLNRGLL